MNQYLFFSYTLFMSPMSLRFSVPVCVCVCVCVWFTPRMIQRSQAETYWWWRWWYTRSDRKFSCPVWRAGDVWQSTYICYTNSRRALDSGVLILPPSEDRQRWWLWRRPRRCSVRQRHQASALAVSCHHSGSRFRSLCACCLYNIDPCCMANLPFRSVGPGSFHTEMFSVTVRSNHGPITAGENIVCVYWSASLWTLLLTQYGRNVTVCAVWIGPDWSQRNFLLLLSINSLEDNIKNYLKGLGGRGM
jgi:hypothetical protein